MNIPHARLANKQSRENLISNQKTFIEYKINEAIKGGSKMIVVRQSIEPEILTILNSREYVIKIIHDGLIISWY